MTQELRLFKIDMLGKMFFDSAARCDCIKGCCPAAKPTVALPHAIKEERRGRREEGEGHSGK